MLEYYEKIVQSVEAGINVDSLYLNFEKAFDKVDHGLLCHRLKEKRIWGKTGIWVADFLKTRTQKVMANGEISKSENIVSGVPQGSVLGPLLFLLVIDSIGELDIKLFMSCFADYTKILYPIKSTEDAEYFQECLLKLNQWQIDNNMNLTMTSLNFLNLGRMRN